MPMYETIDVRTHALADGWESTIGIAENGQPVVGRIDQVLTTRYGLSMSALKKSVVRRSLESKPLPEGRYELRVRRRSVEVYETDPSHNDVVMLGDVNEITTEDVRYRNTALAVVKVPLGAKISGIPNVTHITGGKKIRVWDKATGNWVLKPSSNPAWIAMNILCNSRYAGNAPLSRLVLDQWREWAEFCDANGLSFNGVFDSTTNVWDAVMKVFRTGHAQMVRIGTRYGVSIERAEPISMMFSTANIIEGSFEESWTSADERANVIEGTYADVANDFKERTLRVFDKTAVNQGKPERVSRVDLMGVTSEAQANKDLTFMLYYNRLIRMGCKFEAPIEAIGCRVGDVIAVQHDMPQWGFGGRTNAGSTTTVVNLDRQVEMIAGRSYALLVHYPALQRHAGTITAVSTIADEMTLTCSGMTGTYIDNLDRIVVAGQDRRVLRTWNSGSTYGVIVETDPAITTGASYQLWTTDAMENRNVVNSAPVGGSVQTTQLALQSALPAAPGQFVNFMFGEVNKQYKQFRLKKIEGDGGYTRTLTCIEYNETIYTADPRELTPPTALTTTVSQAIIDDITEQTYQNGGYIENRVTVHFHSPDRTYGYSNVWYSLNGGGWLPMPDGVDQSTISLSKGATVKFKVLAHNAFGKSAPEAFATVSSTYTVQGKTTGTAPVTGITPSFVDAGILIKWDEYPDPELWISTTFKVGGTSWETAELVRTAKTTQATMPFKTPGNYTLRFKHRSALGESAEATYGLVVQPPVTPTIVGVNSTGLTATARWLSSKSDQKITSYVVRAGGPGDTFATSTVVATNDGNTLNATFQALATWTKLWVTGTDASGAFITSGPFFFSVSEVVGTPGVPGQDSLGYVDPSWTASFGGSGDLVFKLNSTTGLNTDAGEIYIAGTKFNHPDGAQRTAGLSGSVLTPYGDGSTTGRFYLMYSNIAVATRFSSLPSANLGTAANLIPVKKVGTNWVAFDNLGNTQTFAPAASDCFIAALEAVTNTGGLTGIYSYLSGAPGSEGPAGQNSATITIYKRSASAPTGPTATTTYTFATAVLAGLNNGWTTTIPAGTTQLWACVASAVNAGATDTIAASEWTSPVQLVANGADGSPGINSATVFLYQRSDSPTAPTLPSAAVTYTFATGIASGLTNGWTQTVPAGTGTYLYVTTATAAATGATDTIATTEWAAVRVLARDGNAGQNSATITVYKRSATTPTGPSAATTYTFSTATLTGLNNGWTVNAPAGTTPLWACAASAVSASDTDTIAAAEWSTPVQLVSNGQDGVDGNPGINTATIFLYQRTNSAVAPALPTAAVTYTFATGIASGLTGGWTQAVPGGTGVYLYITTATALGTGATDTIATTEWAAVRLLATDGADGVNGQRGTVNIAAEITGSTWTDAAANAALAAQGYGTHVVFDVVTLYNNAATPAFSQTRYWSGSAWTAIDQFLHGNLFVDKSIAAPQINTNGLDIRTADGEVLFSAGNTQNTDSATVFGFNPTFANWTGTLPVGWTQFGTGAPVKNIALRMGAPYSVEYVTAATTSQGMYRHYTFGAPLAAGSYLQGSVTMYMLNNNGGGKPGYLVRLYTNSGLTAWQDTFVPIADQTVSGWQRMSFIAGAPGQQIYAIRIYQMASWSGAPGGNGAAGNDILYGPFTFEVRNRITSANATTFMADAAIGWAQIGDLEISTSGAVHSGQPAYNTGTGFWVGHAGGIPKLSIGNPNGNHLLWDGANLIVNTDVLNYVKTGVVGDGKKLISFATGLGGAEGQAGIQFWSDGTIKRKANAVVSAYSSWYSPTTTGVGSGYWVRFLKTAQDSNTSLSGFLGTWQQLNSTCSVQLSTSGINGTFTATLTYEISTTSTGSNIVATGDITLVASREP